MDGNKPVSVTLPLAAWPQLVDALASAPVAYRIVHPIIQAIMAQVQAPSADPSPAPAVTGDKPPA